MGVQFLREHMPCDAGIHYSILDAGGVSPNVVQHQASVLYMIRSNFVKDCMAMHQRVDKIAQGAALMTDTTIERRFVDGLSDTVCNHRAGEGAVRQLLPAGRTAPARRRSTLSWRHCPPPTRA